MGKPSYRDKGKVKHCKYSKERLPQLAFCEALKLDAYVHAEKVTVNPMRKYQNIISNTQAFAWGLQRGAGKLRYTR